MQFNQFMIVRDAYYNAELREAASRNDIKAYQHLVEKKGADPFHDGGAHLADNFIRSEARNFIVPQPFAGPQQPPQTCFFYAYRASADQRKGKLATALIDRVFELADERGPYGILSQFKAYFVNNMFPEPVFSQIIGKGLDRERELNESVRKSRPCEVYKGEAGMHAYELFYFYDENKGYPSAAKMDMLCDILGFAAQRSACRAPLEDAFESLKPYLEGVDGLKISPAYIEKSTLVFCRPSPQGAAVILENMGIAHLDEARVSYQIVQAANWACKFDKKQTEEPSAAFDWYCQNAPQHFTANVMKNSILRGCDQQVLKMLEVSTASVSSQERGELVDKLLSRENYYTTHYMGAIVEKICEQGVDIQTRGAEWIQLASERKLSDVVRVLKAAKKSAKASSPTALFPHTAAAVSTNGEPSPHSAPKHRP